MKYVLIAAALYQTLVGVGELTWISTSNTTLASIAALPSAASLADSMVVASFPNSANVIEGSADLAIAAGLFYLAMRWS